MRFVISDSSVKRLDLERASLADIHLRAVRADVVHAPSLTLAGRIKIDDSPALSELHRHAQRPAARILIDGREAS
jgi:hypothetical protein